MIEKISIVAVFVAVMFSLWITIDWAVDIYGPWLGVVVAAACLAIGWIIDRQEAAD